MKTTSLWKPLALFFALACLSGNAVAFGQGNTYNPVISSLNSDTELCEWTLATLNYDVYDDLSGAVRSAPDYLYVYVKPDSMVGFTICADITYNEHGIDPSDFTWHWEIPEVSLSGDEDGSSGYFNTWQEYNGWLGPSTIWMWGKVPNNPYAFPSEQQNHLWMSLIPIPYVDRVEMTSAKDTVVYGSGEVITLEAYPDAEDMPMDDLHWIMNVDGKDLAEDNLPAGVSRNGNIFIIDASGNR